MLPVNFNKDFAKAFTQDCILYSAIEEYSHGNLLFMQFTGDLRQMKPIAISIANNIYQGKLVSRLETVLANKSIPQLAFLCSMVNNLITEFNSYIQYEPHTCSYCTELIHTLESFHELVKSLNNDLCGQVSTKLKAIQAAIYNPAQPVEDGYYLYEVIDQIEFYLKNLLTYYYHFLIVRQQENENCEGIVGFTTQVADHLSELIRIIETVSNDIENVLDLLLTREVFMDLCEEQALYN